MALTDKQIKVLETVAGATHQSEVIDYLPEFTAAQVKGILVSLATKELILLNKIEGGDKTIDLTKKGKALIVADEPELPAPAVEAAHWIDVHTRRTPGCTACDEVAKNDVGDVDPDWYDRPIKKKLDNIEDYTVTDEFYSKLSRKQCLAILAAGNYDGPVSYLMPKLRAITERHGFLTTDMEAEILGTTNPDE